MAKLSAKVPSLGAIRTSPCTSWDTPPSGGRTSRMRSVSETAKTPSLIPSVRSVRYFRPVFSLSSFDEPSHLMKFSRQLPFDPAGWSENRFRASRVVGAKSHLAARVVLGTQLVQLRADQTIRIASEDDPVARTIRGHDLVDRLGCANRVTRKHLRGHGRHDLAERSGSRRVRLDRGARELREIREPGAERARLDQARAQADRLDLLPQRFRQAFERELARRVEAIHWEARDAVHRRDVDDRACLRARIPGRTRRSMDTAPKKF